jgi:integrase/recombinase XerC
MSVRVRQSPLPFAPESAKWVEELTASGKSDATIECYSRDLRDVAQAINARETKNLLSLGQGSVETMTRTWCDDGTSLATVSRRFSALRGFAVYLVREHGLDLSRFLSAEFPGWHKGKRPGLGENIVQSLLSETQLEVWRDLRDSALFAVQASAGLTPSEATSLDFGDIDLDRRLVAVRETHLARRLAGLSEQSEGLLKQYLLALPFLLEKTDPLFVTSRRSRLSVRSVQLSFRRRRLRLGIAESACPMGLRHGVGSKLAGAGASPAVLACALGISRTTAARYFETDH